MIDGVQDVYYEAVDVGRALRFYRDVLGLEVTGEGENWASLRVGAVRLGLHSSHGRPVAGRAVLTLRSTDLSGDVERLRARGVRLVGEIEDFDWGRIVALEDSEGNLLKLMQPPAAPVHTTVDGPNRPQAMASAKVQVPSGLSGQRRHHAGPRRRGRRPRARDR